MEDQTQLWNRSAGHLKLKLLKYLKSHKLVNVLQKLRNKGPSLFGPYQHGKQNHVPHKPKPNVSTSHCLQLLYLGLVGPKQIKSLAGKKCLLLWMTIQDSHEFYFLFTKVMLLRPLKD